MAQKDDGGPAFPHEELNDDGSFFSVHKGMSLRDWFAGQALNQATREIWAEHKFEDVAKRCYLFADAMLEARNK